MCGRFSFAPKPKQLESLPVSAEEIAGGQLIISYNIAPTHAATVIANNQPTHLQQMEWGLVPFRSADGHNSGKLINARAEGIEEKPSFREPVHTRRCLVMADSFYEWRTVRGKKVPYRIFLKNGDLMWMAAIWDEWKKSGPQKRTFSIITTTPNAEMAAVHNRMPVILADENARKTWLSDHPLPKILNLLHPLPDGLLAMYRISDRLNKPQNNDPDLHREIPEELTLF